MSAVKLINLLIKYHDIIKNNTVQISHKFRMLLCKIENKNLALYFNIMFNHTANKNIFLPLLKNRENI